jgi:hypothetical protein
MKFAPILSTTMLKIFRIWNSYRTVLSKYHSGLICCIWISVLYKEPNNLHEDNNLGISTLRYLNGIHEMCTLFTLDISFGTFSILLRTMVMYEYLCLTMEKILLNLCRTPKRKMFKKNFNTKQQVIFIAITIV